MQEINLDSFEYFIQASSIDNILLHLDKSYAYHKTYYYPVYRNWISDLNLCKKMDFSHGQTHTCIFYTQDILYLGTLVSFDEKTNHLFYLILSKVEEYQNEYLFLDFFEHPCIVRKANDCSIVRNLHYYDPFDTRLIGKSANQLKDYNNLDAISMNDNKHIMALFKNPKLEKSYNGDYYWKNGNFDKNSLDYFTIGHLCRTGVILQNGTHYPINSLADFFFLLAHTLKSKYEANFMLEYLRYVITLPIDKQLSLPLLIPEFRFGGPQIKHKYRLDFLIINLAQDRRFGIELSPTSTHSDAEHPEKQWYKESNKRNEFLLEYDIPIITYTEIHMKKIEEIFYRDIVPMLAV